ncbi:MAG: hypothetical protein ABIH72_00905 [archaeon]
MPKILYAREYPVDLPDDAKEKATILTEHTVSEAIEIIQRERDFSGYVLGMVMVREGVRLEDMDNIYENRFNLFEKIYEITGGDEIDLDELEKRLGYEKVMELTNLRKQSEILDSEKWELLDVNAGEQVFQYLEEIGEVGKKPVLWYTSQYPNNKLTYPDSKKLIELADIPIRDEVILKWLDKLK